MLNIFEMKQQQKEALTKAEAVLTAAGNRKLLETEQAEYDKQMGIFEALEPRIKMHNSVNTIRGMMTNGTFILEGEAADAPGFMQALTFPPIKADLRTPEYSAALQNFLVSGGKAIGPELKSGADGIGGFAIPGSEAFTRQRRPNAALYEGTQGNSTTAGGDAINVETLQQIVPLGLPDLGIYDASMVIPTANDLKIPQQASFGTSTVKAESNGTIAQFGGSDPTLGQITLSSFMAGAVRVASYELLQDVSMFQQFLVQDLLAGQRILEDSLLASGSGSGQALGIFGNTGNGTGSAYALTGASTDAAVLLNALFDVVATLKAAYQPNASWIMSRATGLAIRRAQMQTNLFAPVVTVDADGTERILGRPVFYDVNAPALPTATTAGVPSILFGDFKQGYIVGVRGGEGINVKILDQPLAMQGQIAILAYRRIDGKIRRSEAIQQISFSHA